MMKRMICGALGEAFAGDADQTRQQQLQELLQEVRMRRFGFYLAGLALIMSGLYFAKPSFASHPAPVYTSHPVVSIGQVFRGF